MNPKITKKPLSESQYNDLRQLNQEYQIGFEILNQITNPKVTFYGGSNLSESSEMYNEVKNIAAEFAKKGWTVMTGGGPGVMRAALEGAKSVGGQTVGFKIDITNEPSDFEPDFTHTFEHFAPRKYALRQAEVYIYCPGSIGTLDELMENIDLLKTDKLTKRPIFLLGTDFWKGLDQWINSEIVKEYQLGDKSILKLYDIVDSADQIWKILDHRLS